MNPIHPTTTLILMLGLSGCQNTLVLKSETFTPPGSFTAEAEGPAVDADGNLYAVSYQTKPTVGRISPSGQGEIYLNMPEGSTANGIRFSSTGSMYLADYTGHNVLQVDRQKNFKVFAHNPAMNQPNDLAIVDSDILFASDPNWEAGTGQLWRIDTDGKTTLLEKDMGTTNGVEVSPDNRTLYVNESVQRNVWAYDLDATGNIANKRRLIRFEDFGLDGMRCDVQGNLYITRHGKGEVAIVSPDGKQIGAVQLIGQEPTNIAFGGKDGRTGYVTLADRGNIETFRAPHPGRSWAMRQERED
jgi:sugar lactone lactonase YvrE